MRSLKILALRLLKALGVFHLARYWTRRHVRILCYHGIWLGKDGYPGDAMFMLRTTFESRLKAIKKWNFPVVPLEQAVIGIQGSDMPPCPVVITIDDGWYSIYSEMLPLLQQYDMPATLYCDTANLISCQPVPHVMALYLKKLLHGGYCGIPYRFNATQSSLYDFVVNTRGKRDERLETIRQLAKTCSFNIEVYFEEKVFSYMSTEQLSKSYREGLDVQLHTHSHSMHDYCDEELKREIDENRRHLSRILSVNPLKFKHFCYPSGNFSLASGRLLEKIGISSSTTCVRSLADKMTNLQFLPRILDGEQVTLLEFEAEMFGVLELIRQLCSFFKGRRIESAFQKKPAIG